MTGRPGRLLSGAAVVVLAWAGMTWFSAPRIEADLQAAIQDAPDAAALRRAGTRVEIQGRDAVIVTEFALANSRIDEFTRIIESVRGIARVRTVTAVPVPMQPFRLIVARSAGRLSLKGGVPAGGLHAQLLERASAAHGGVIEDHLAPGLGAPDGFDAAADVTLGIALRLSRGEAVLSDRTLSVKGETSDFAAYSALSSDLLALPPGYAHGPVEVLPPVVSSFVWGAERGPAGLRLTGYVPSEAARGALRATAERLLPGLALADEMQVARGLDPSIDFAQLGVAGLRALAALDEGQVAFGSKRLAVSGTSAARELLAGLPAEIGRALPAGVVPGRMGVRAVPARPYRLLVHRADDRVTLSGYAPDAATRDALRQSADQTFPGEAVRVDLHLADGAPDGFAAAANLALAGVSQLAEGRAELLDRRILVAGRALYAEMADQLRRKIASSVPDGWSGASEVRSAPSEKPLETSLCEDLLNDSQRREPIRFEPNSVETGPASQAALNGLLDIARRCGPASIRVAVRATDLAAARAATVARVLKAGSGADVVSDGAAPAAASKAASGDTVLFRVEAEEQR